MLDNPAHGLKCKLIRTRKGIALFEPSLFLLFSVALEPAAVSGRAAGLDQQGPVAVRVVRSTQTPSPAVGRAQERAGPSIQTAEAELLTPTSLPVAAELPVPLIPTH